MKQPHKGHPQTRHSQLDPSIGCLCREASIKLAQISRCMSGLRGRPLKAGLGEPTKRQPLNEAVWQHSDAWSPKRRAWLKIRQVGLRRFWSCFHIPGWHFGHLCLSHTQVSSSGLGARAKFPFSEDMGDKTIGNDLDNGEIAFNQAHVLGLLPRIFTLFRNPKHHSGICVHQALVGCPVLQLRNASESRLPRAPDTLKLRQMYLVANSLQHMAAARRMVPAWHLVYLEPKTKTCITLKPAQS